MTSYLQRLIKNAKAKEQEMFKQQNPIAAKVDMTSHPDLDFAADMEREMRNMTSPNNVQTVPANLTDRHLVMIKELSGQADEYEAEVKRLLTLAKEARLGIAALEAANRVLEDGLQKGIPVTESDYKIVDAALHNAKTAALSEAGE